MSTTTELTALKARIAGLAGACDTASRDKSESEYERGYNAALGDVAFMLREQLVNA